MKKYVAPEIEIIVLTSDLLMMSDENETLMDSLDSIFGPGSGSGKPGGGIVLPDDEW